MGGLTFLFLLTTTTAGIDLTITPLYIAFD
jgi:hypothetical protein